MYLSGFADEAAKGIDGQIRATQALGWKHIESRNVDGTNLTRVSDAKFDEVFGKLEQAGITVNCFGSGIANWACKLTDPPDSSYKELEAAIPRMHRLGTKLVRIMSFVVPVEDSALGNEAVATEVIKRVGHLARMAEDGGVTLVHENCNSWGGRSYEHTLKLLERVDSPALKLVFDTGNPVFEPDVRGEPPHAMQDALEFYHKVRDHIAYVHIKDGRLVEGTMVFSFPGEGDGHVREIVADLHKSGYDGGISMEPHLAVVHHDAGVQSDARVMFDNYVEYGRRFKAILHDIGWSPDP
ncbi:MAG: TIM barrel protein [Chitinivibrionales bacterium]|nr:TIM barrel protein [Chitinivibrionales bacterium]MBD3395452.1 TIM barrel protein [Chitinivibrionales bacterium]